MRHNGEPMAIRISGNPTRRYSAGGSILGILAMSLGVGSAAFIWGKSMTPQPASERYKAYVPEYDVIEVPVPEKPVPAGMIMRDVPVRLEKFPSHQVPSGAVREARSILNKVTLVALPGGLPIIETNLGRSEDIGAPLMGKIPAGMRAMTVKVDLASSGESWAQGGALVDVLLVEKNHTTVVAEAVKVISVDRSGPVGGGGFTNPDSAGVSRIVTLLVSQEQCLAINTAVPIGRIAFALRSSQDETSWRATHFSSEELSAPKREQEPAHIEGMASFGLGADRRQYALVKGRWIPADSIQSAFPGHPTRDAPEGTRKPETDRYQGDYRDE